MHKRAALFEFNLLWFLAIFLMIFLFAGILYLVNYTLDLQKDTTRVRANIFLSRAVYSDNGLSYRDEVTGRLYPGLIDFNKFNSNTLENEIFYEDNKMFAAKISLFDSNNKQLAQFYYNQKMYDIWMPAVTFKEYRKISMKRQILILKDGTTKEGYLNIEAVTPYG